MNDVSLVLEAKEYALACSQMGRRTRAWLRLMSVACLVAIGIYWTNRFDNFAAFRLAVYHEALYLKVPGNSGDKATRRRWTETSQLADDMARRYSIDELNKRITLLEERQLKKLSFHAPVVDLDFDMNDLAAISGLTFLGLVALLRLSILKELIVTRLAFTRTRQTEHFAEFYERSCLLQTSLGSSAEKRTSYRFWRATESGLVILPVFLGATITWDYLKTLSLETGPTGSSLVSLIVSVTSLCVSALFAWLSLHDLYKIDRFWQEARAVFRTLGAQEEPGRFQKQHQHAHG